MAGQRPWLPMNVPGPWSIDLPGGGPWKIVQNKSQDMRRSTNSFFKSYLFLQTNAHHRTFLSPWSELIGRCTTLQVWPTLYSSNTKLEKEYLRTSPPHRRRRVLGLSMLHGHEVIHVHGGWTARVLLARSKHVIHTWIASSPRNTSHATATATHRRCGSYRERQDEEEIGNGYEAWQFIWDVGLKERKTDLQLQEGSTVLAPGLIQK